MSTKTAHPAYKTEKPKPKPASIPQYAPPERTPVEQLAYDVFWGIDAIRWALAGQDFAAIHAKLKELEAACKPHI